jgi:hypothetical protein
MKTYGGVEVFLDLGINWRWVESITPRPLYPWGKISRYPMDRRLGGLHSRSGRREEKIRNPTKTRAPTPQKSIPSPINSSKQQRISQSENILFWKVKHKPSNKDDTTVMETRNLRSKAITEQVGSSGKAPSCFRMVSGSNLGRDYSDWAFNAVPHSCQVSGGAVPPLGHCDILSSLSSSVITPSSAALWSELHHH